jgi:hypothetical protein
MRPSEPAMTRPPGRPVAPLIVAALSVIALVVCSLVHGWLDSGLIDMRVGLRGATTCTDRACEAVSTGEVVGQFDRARADSKTNDCIERGLEQCYDDANLMACQDQVVERCAPAASGRGRAFVVTGWITSVAIWLGVLGLLATAGLALTGKQPNLPIAPSTIAFLALAVSIITGCVFVAVKPGDTGMLGISWAFWVFAAGAVGGIVSSMLLARALRPAIGDWDPGDEPEGPPPAWESLTPPPR